uniref:4Fe-4S ferredoxin-type domain-containing protein n=1 Tax=uncultured bacterium contig00061 TaxID=1181544 RepID=A0A806JYZ7_9BACT|nr:hypothetical protein [uncultured bacterium contig00061]
MEMKIFRDDDKKCSACPAYLTVCPVAYCEEGGKAIVNQGECTGCGNCITVCLLCRNGARKRMRN